MTDYIAKVVGPRYNYVVVRDPWMDEDKPTYWVIRRDKRGASISAVAFRNVHSAFLFMSKCVAGMTE